ncbi:autotransporter outer membrane beta-barrel domain-containing protein [Neisseria bergeri]|uniref:autotransporter outer membrane beta-barrel domain-containing protein n=1 Tax=Neisseria bergeri TaxID=1906581 RepID=UPI0035573C43
MKQNRKFALSTIALLIQVAIATQANAEAREIPVNKTTDYIGLITNDEEQVWTDDSIIVNKYIQPYWEKNKPHRKLGVVTTGKGDNGNLEVNGFYGILSYAERELNYKPELYIKSNNDIIFNNNFQSVYIQPYSNTVNLEAKGKIDFNLNLLEKAADDKGNEYLVNDKSLVRYINYTSDNSKGSLSLTSKKGNHLNLKAKIHNGIHHSGIVNHLNTNVNLTATEGDNVISLNAQLMDEIADPANFSTSSYLRGIETAFKSHTTLVGENNKVSITTEGNGLGLELGKRNPSNDSPYSGHTTGIFVNNQSNNLTDPTIDKFSSVNLKATKGNNEVDINVRNHSSVKGIVAIQNAKATIEAEEGNNIIKVRNPDLNTPIEKAEGEHYRAGIQSATDSKVTLTAKNNIVEVSGNLMNQEGFQVFANASITATAKENNEITVENAAYSSDGVATLIPQANDRPSLTNDGNKIILEAGKDNIITMRATDADMDYLENSTVLKETDYYKDKKGSNGIFSAGDKSLVKLTGENNYILTELSDKARAFKHNGVMSQDGAKVEITAKEDNAIAGANNGSNANTQATVTIDGKNNTILAFQNGMKAFGKGKQTVTATEKNEIIGGETGVLTANEDSSVTLKGENNKVSAKLGLYAFDQSQQTLTATEDNTINVKHEGIKSENKATINLTATNKNSINSTAENSQGIVTLNEGKVSLGANENVISAKLKGIESDSKSTVTLTAGDKNEIKDAQFGIYSLNESHVSLSSKNQNTIESTNVGSYAQDKGIINIDGKDNHISGGNFALVSDKSGKQTVIATNGNKITSRESGIYANENSSVSLTASNNIINSTNVGISSLNNAKVDVNGQIKLSSKIANHASTEGRINLNYADKSEITGATISNGGNIAIKPLDLSHHMVTLTGDVLAVNNGKVELDFTPNSRLVGRLDNFSGLTDSKHKDLFEQYVTKLDSKSAGEINLNLAKDALWTMTGQSWMDKLSGEGTVDFDSNSKTSGRALHIGELAGANKFLMHLNKDGIHSDMLYVKKGTSTPQEVVVKNLSEVLDSMNYGERLRFATVTDSKNEFVNGKKYIDDTHLMEDALTVEYSAHNGDKNNEDAYNKSFNGSEMTTEKAGNNYIDQTYAGGNRQNVYLVKQTTGNPGRNVKNINDMFDSTAHYAFTLDTYTKREGERAFSTLDKKEGDWIRLTHTRLIQSNAFRFHNNDFEIGYDRFSLNEQEKKRKWGISFDYGHGRTSLWNTFGKGKIRKYELALYNTTQYIDKEGDETGYIDNVLKIGKLRNRVIARNHMGQLWGEGKYSNTLFSISTEYGRRKFLDDDKLWRITPQVQLQYSYLRGAGYRLDNGINVNLSHVNSLIGRLGLDVVRKFDEGKKLFYIKGNILREFLGSRSFKAFEGNSNYAQKWNTRGTWYSAGLGYNARTGKKTNVFADAEKEFSGGKKGSYNIRLSVSHQFD